MEKERQTEEKILNENVVENIYNETASGPASIQYAESDNLKKYSECLNLEELTLKN